MKKVLLIFCAISLLAESAVAAQDHSTTTSSKGGQEQGTALSKQSDNSQHNKKDDAAAITSMALTNPIGAMAASWAAGKLLKLVGLQAECQTGKIVVTDPQNCPPCATDYAVKAKIAFLAGCLPTCTGPHAPACTAACYVASEEVYASTYATIESACRGEPAVNIPPTGKCVSYPDRSCAVCPASVQFKYEPFMVIWPDMSNLLVAGIKLATQGFLGHANEIIATLQGDEGHVTDKWVGPRPRNTVVKTMGDKIAVSSRSFGSLSFDAS